MSKMCLQRSVDPGQRLDRKASKLERQVLRGQPDDPGEGMEETAPGGTYLIEICWSRGGFHGQGANS